jgi:aspartyl protease family protein
MTDGAASALTSSSAPALTGFGRPIEAHGQIAIAPDSSGNFRTDVEIDGHLIHMVVDTGATYVSLTNEDADAIGLRPGPADYTYKTMTANGAGVAAKVHIDRLQVGGMEIDDVDAFILPAGALGTSLLGMSALNRLGSVEMSNGTLVLRQ